MVKVGFLGPHGTFAEEALLTQPDFAAGDAVPFRDVPHVITAVETGEVDLGIVPIENSIEVARRSFCTTESTRSTTWRKKYERSYRKPRSSWDTVR